MKPHVRAVTFDVGGTLIHPWPSVGDVYARVAARHGFSDITPDVLTRNFIRAWKAKTNFKHTRAQWRELVEQSFAGAVPGSVSDLLFEDIYSEFALAQSWRLAGGARQVLTTLKMHGFKLAIISNWDSRLRLLLPQLGIDSFFDAVLISCEVGFCKPSQEIFNHAAKKLRETPGSILHIGDSLKEDYLGARSAGFRALLLDDQTQADHAIGSLSDVLAALQS